MLTGATDPQQRSSSPSPPDTRKIAFYTDELDTTPVLTDVTWEGLVDFFCNYVEESPCSVEEGAARCKGKECSYKAHSAIAGNPMAWAPTHITGKRLDANVHSISYLTFDFDHLTQEAAQHIATKLAGYAYIWHSTHNHRADDIAFRVIMNTSRVIGVHEYHRFLAAAISFLGVTVVDKKEKSQPDPTCKNRSRLYYRPSHPKGAPHFAEAFAGIALDVDRVLAWGLAQQAAPTTPERVVGDTPALPDESEWDLDSEVVQDAIDLVARYFPPNQRNELCLALGGMLRRAGVTIDGARYIVREICVQGGSKNPDARAKTVDHTWALTDESAMTGFTRVGEILGEDVAIEFGSYLTQAANEAFLRGVSIQPANGRANGHSNGTNGANGHVVAPSISLVPQPVVDLAAIRRQVSELAGRKSRSFERNDKVLGVLLRRALAGEPLTYPGDVETVLTDATAGISVSDATYQVLQAIGWGLDSKPSWDVIAEILRLSLAATRRVYG